MVGGHDVVVDGHEEERPSEGARPKAYWMRVERGAWQLQEKGVYTSTNLKPEGA